MSEINISLRGESSYNQRVTRIDLQSQIACTIEDLERLAEGIEQEGIGGISLHLTRAQVQCLPPALVNRLATVLKIIEA